MERLEKCRVADICGGCQLQHLDYQAQLEYKQNKMERLFGKMKKVEPIIGCENPYHYRNKVQMAFSSYGKRVVCGNYVESTHQIVEIKNCQIADKKANEIINTIKQLVGSFRISTFDENRYTGCLRHVMIRLSAATSQIMVILVTGSYNIPYKKDFIAELLKSHPQITTIVQCVNNKRTSMVLTDKFNVLYGKGYIEDKLNGLTFRISPSAFYQVNLRQTEVLYNTAINLAKLSKNDVVLDAYCGTGTIGLSLADRVKEVYGVEINRQAIKDARINSKINQIDNAEFIAADAGKYISQLALNHSKVDVVIMDPPRSGADDRFLKSLVALKPKKIVYISCNPLTQKTNLQFLLKHGYQLEVIQPVDMFPFTEHVESIALAVRK
ncbi:MAG: 23S rRNA (uracil(1939)-C(5))-methyltransferase RlmD [Erysipelotrichaceae bacterium]